MRRKRGNVLGRFLLFLPLFCVVFLVGLDINDRIIDSWFGSYYVWILTFFIIFLVYKLIKYVISYVKKLAGKK